MTRPEQTLALTHEQGDASEPTALCLPVQHGADGRRRVAVAEPVTSRIVYNDFSLRLWCLAGPERWPVCLSFPRAD